MKITSMQFEKMLIRNISKYTKANRRYDKPPYAAVCLLVSGEKEVICLHGGLRCLAGAFRMVQIWQHPPKQKRCECRSNNYIQFSEMTNTPHRRNGSEEFVLCHCFVSALQTAPVRLITICAISSALRRSSSAIQFCRSR